MSKNDYIVKAFESIGEALSHKDTEISLLKYEITRLKEELERGIKNDNGRSFKKQ